MMNYKFIFTVCITLFFFQIATAQRFDQRKLNLYKPGAKVITFQVGNDMTFQLKGIDRFHTFQITDLQGDSIFFDNHIVRLKEIQAVKYARSGGNSAQTAAASLYIFGSSWLLYTGVDDVMGNDPSWIRAGIIAATAGALGGILHLFSRPKTYVLDNDKYLRILIP
jgi:hypothetical protein